MPPIRFRIRTLMIAIAAVAVLMGLFRFYGSNAQPHRRHHGSRGFNGCIAVLADVIATRRQRLLERARVRFRDQNQLKAGSRRECRLTTGWKTI